MSPADAATHRAAVRRCVLIVALAGQAAFGWDYRGPALMWVLAAAVAVGVLGAAVDAVLGEDAELMVRGLRDRS